MKRRASVLATAALAGTLVGPALPASADVAVCAGAGTASLSQGIYYTPLIPVIGTEPTPNVGWDIAATVAVCGPSGLAAVSGSGTLSSAACGNSVGTGVATHNGNDHDITITTAANIILVTGEAVGVFDATPITPVDCAWGIGNGADTFAISGVLAFIDA